MDANNVVALPLDTRAAIPDVLLVARPSSAWYYTTHIAFYTGLIVGLSWWQSTRLEHALRVSLQRGLPAHLDYLELRACARLAVGNRDVREDRGVADDACQGVAVVVRRPLVLCRVGVSGTGVARVDWG
jgi:hypothetical protein